MTSQRTHTRSEIFKNDSLERDEETRVSDAESWAPSQGWLRVDVTGGRSNGAAWYKRHGVIVSNWARRGTTSA